MSASIRDYAAIARAVYEPTKEAAKSFATNNGWTYIEFRAGQFTSGFQGAVFFKHGSNPPEFVVAFKGSKGGTTTTGISDWLVNDSLIGLKQIPTQYPQAQQLLNLAAQSYGALGTITLVGHSLGGALVQCVAANMIRHAALLGPGAQSIYRFVNFNGPGMVRNFGHAAPGIRGYNYIVRSDKIGNHPDKTGASHFGTFYRATSALSAAKAHGMGGVISSFAESHANQIVSIATLDQLGI